MIPPDDLAAEVTAAVDARMAERLAEYARRQAAQRVVRTRRTAARDAGLRARHATKLNRIRKAQMSDDLRRAIGALSPRERHVLRQQSEQAARKWTGTLPGLAQVWTAFAAVVADVDQNDRARRAAEPPEQTMRPARRPRA